MSYSASFNELYGNGNSYEKNSVLALEKSKYEMTTIIQVLGITFGIFFLFVLFREMK